MDNIRKVVSAILDKADQLLTSEPARMIGYGAAVLVYLIIRLVGELKPGLVPQVGFEEAVGMAFSALATVVILVESIRRFVYSPLTYIEDLADESQAAHEAAHLEEDLRRWKEAIAAQQAAEAQPQTKTVVVGTAKAGGSGDKSN